MPSLKLIDVHCWVLSGSSMGPEAKGPRAVHFPLVFFLASKAPPWTSFFCEFFIENGFLLYLFFFASSGWWPLFLVEESSPVEVS